MYSVLIGLIIFIALLLILVVLVQNSKGGGLAQFGGANTSQLMGVKRTGDILEQLTWGFAVAMILLTLGTNVLADRGTTTESTSPNIQRAQQKSTIPAGTQTQPAAPATTDTTKK